MSETPPSYQTLAPSVNHLVTGHFRERKGYWARRDRGTADWLLIYTIQGSGRFGFGAGQITTAPGDLVMLQPRTLHDYGAAESGDAPTGTAAPAGLPARRGGGRSRPDPGEAGCASAARRPAWELLWTHFHPRPHWHEWLAWPQLAPGLCRLRIAAGPPRRHIAACFAEVHRLATGSQRRREDLAMNALEQLLLLCDAHNPASQPSAIDARVRGAMDYICGHLGEKIALQDIADAAALSVSRLAHLFRRQVGTTPQRFLELQRLNRGKQLLELTSRSVKQIAQEVGFDSPFYFTLRFKRNVGISPRAYRIRETRREEA